MTERKKLPELPVDALRDHASAELVDGIWQRLQPEVSVRRQERSATLWWGAAAAVAIFASGAFLGMQVNAPAPVALVQPEDRPEPSPAPAAEPTLEREPEKSNPQPHEKQRHRSSIRRLVPAAVPIESAPPLEPPAPAPAPLPVAPEPAALPAWQEYAAQLEYDAASSALAAEGGFPAALERATPEQLMTLHDIARATGNRVHALDALRQVVELHSDNPNAPVAAWSLGNMLESAGDSLGAAQAYAAYRALSPQGDFAEDALARQVEIIREQGDLIRAQGMAKQYVQEFKSGRHIDEMQLLADQAKVRAPEGGAVESTEDDEADEHESPTEARLAE